MCVSSQSNSAKKNSPSLRQGCHFLLLNVVQLYDQECPPGSWACTHSFIPLQLFTEKGCGFIFRILNSLIWSLVMQSLRPGNIGPTNVGMGRQQKPKIGTLKIKLSSVYFTPVLWCGVPSHSAPFYLVLYRSQRNEPPEPIRVPLRPTERPDDAPLALDWLRWLAAFRVKCGIVFCAMAKCNTEASIQLATSLHLSNKKFHFTLSFDHFLSFTWRQGLFQYGGRVMPNFCSSFSALKPAGFHARLCQCLHSFAVVSVRQCQNLAVALPCKWSVCAFAPGS